MRQSRITISLTFLAVLLAAAPAGARDWFVRAESTGGDGSREKPFADPWEALEKCEAGDAIHVAGGEYFGRLESGCWSIPFERVQLVGGYDAAFGARDPWKNRTRLSWKNGKNRPAEPRVSSTARGVVLDGLVLDSREQNNYVDEAGTGRVDKIGYESLRLGMPATVRNCVVVNPGRAGVVCQPGSTVENNLILNALDVGIDVAPGSGDFERTPAKVRGNTILFVWDEAPGKGGGKGCGIRLGGPAEVSGNLIGHCDNNAIDLLTKVDRVSITNNIFFMNLWSNLRVAVDSNIVAIDGKTMDLLEEVGLKACDGNQVLDPQLELDAAWLDLYSKRTSRQPGKLEMDDWNKLRRARGLPLIATAGEGPTNVAPAYGLEKALLLLTPGNAAVKAGARAVPCQVAYGASPGGTGPSKTYEASDFRTWIRQPESVEGKALEMVVAVGGVSGISGIPAAYNREEHAGVILFDREGKGERLLAFYRKGTAAERTFDQNMGRYSGGVPERLFRVCGVAHALEGGGRGTFFVESIERWEEPAAALAPRPPGRDWFVRAGAAGGDGTREKPFKDPFQALERCEAGDTIHVAEGEYVGKLRAGKWQIDCPQVAMLGGYDAEFKERDPWKRPVLLVCPADFKGRRGGVTFEGIEDHTGFILDGFVFDKVLNNVYAENGDLDTDRSDKAEHLLLLSPGCTVRNCVFVNGAGAAMTVANGQVVENCLVLNHVAFAVEVRAGTTPRPFVFRGNTVAFSWDIRFGQGHGANGALVRLGSGVHAVLEGNVFEFADNDALDCGAQPEDVELRDNVFAHNLWSNVSRGSTVVDDPSFARLGDLGLKACAGNRVLIPGLPLDQKWFDVYLNRTALVPGKVTMDDWNNLRRMLGQPLVAEGGKAGEGFAPAYPWRKALVLAPKNPDCEAGARPRALEAKFNGIVRNEPVLEYAASTWDVAKDLSAWDALDGKRVSLKVAVFDRDNTFPLPDAPETAFEAFKVGSPTTPGDGLPLRCYVKRGTRHARALRLARTDPQSPPESTWIVKGIARAGRQMIVESVERSGE